VSTLSNIVKVRIIGTNGEAAPEYLLNTLYASDLHFEPDIRKSSIMSDGTVEIEVTKKPYMLHARLDIPLYGNIWVMAHNRGQGYTANTIDFVSEALKTYIYEAERLSAGLRLSAYAEGHLNAAHEYRELADKGIDSAYCLLKALSHAIFAAEAALYEAAQAKIETSPRPDMLLGCNTHKYAGDNLHSDYFTSLFNFATIPFYYYQVVPEEGVFDYARRDEILEWCESNQMKAKGHPLWFGHGGVNPKWMFGKSYKELSQFAREYIKKTVTRYRGRIDVWDSINEPHDWANCFDFTQDELMDLARICCDTVRESNPDATSIINVCLPFGEYVAGKFVCYGPVFDQPVSPLAFLERAVEKGIDFDAVGVQMYFPARDMVAISLLLNEYARFGKPVHITEMGVPSGPARGERDNVDTADPQSQIGLTKGLWHAPWDEHVQADWVEQFYTITSARAEIKALTWWDFQDPGFMKTSPFLFEDQVPREMYFRLKALKKRIVG
jgi:GH35 family endo-1,4-beta-xylanase